MKQTPLPDSWSFSYSQYLLAVWCRINDEPSQLASLPGR